jgi:ribose transport system permease protein
MTKTNSKFSNFMEHYAIYIILVALIAILSVINPNFFTTSNLLNVLRQCSIYAILAMGMTFVIISGGIDLSVGALTACCSCIVAIFIVKWGMNMWLAVLLTIIIGGVIGAINGFIIAKMKVPFFLATVGMMYILKGLALVITNENSISGFPKEFAIFGGIVKFPIPPQVIIAAIVFVVLYILLNHTKTGRYTFALGSNWQAAKLSGVNVDRYTINVYMLSGLCAGIAGIILAARLKVGSPITAQGYEMDAVCAVAIGGTSMLGGSGSLAKTIVGALVLTIIRVGLNMLNITTSIQQIIIGLVIVVVVALDMRKRSLI